MNPRHIVVPAYLAACLILGGASAAGFIANLVLQLFALPLIGWALWSLRLEPVRGPARSLLFLTALLVALVLLELVPLPPEIWTHLPGRGPVAHGFDLLGLPLPWLPVSLAPEHSLASLLWLLPAFATMLGILILGAYRASWLGWAIAGVTACAVLLGALQIVGGDQSSAYFYEITNIGLAVGFFANSNHQATLLLIAIPFIAALQRHLIQRSRSARSRSALRLVTYAAFAVIAVGLLLNASLAGLGLSVPVALMTWLAFYRRGGGAPTWLIGAVALLSVAAVAIVFIGPFHNNLLGKQTEFQELSRQTSFRLTLQAAGEYLPVGSGIGTFEQVYHTQEPLKDVTDTYMNHAHSDWLEILLETGVVGIALAALFLLWWAMRVRDLIRAEQPELMARAAAIATGTMMLHSLVDYPLRTAALSAVFAACVALMAGARPYVRRSSRAGEARHLSV